MLWEKDQGEGESRDVRDDRERWDERVRYLCDKPIWCIWSVNGMCNNLNKGIQIWSRLYDDSMIQIGCIWIVMYDNSNEWLEFKMDWAIQFEFEYEKNRDWDSNLRDIQIRVDQS